MTYRLSARAQTDLIEIADYTQDNYGEEQEIAYMAKLFAKLAYVGDNPGGIGTPCGYIRPGLKSYPAYRHTIYYIVRGRVAEIVTIMGATMQAVNHL